MILRPEQPADFDAIHDLIDRAFAPMSFADGTEAQALRQMRADGDLSYARVLEEGGAVIGHVALSPARIGGAEGWFGLGPIAVAPDRQRNGLGKRLLAASIDWARGQNAPGIVLLGNPDVYGSSGFRASGMTWRDVPPAYVLALCFQGAAPQGEVTFAPGLQDPPNTPQELS